MTDDGRHHIDSTKYGLHTIMRLRVSSKQKADLINVISNNIIKLTTYKIHAHKIYNLNLLAWKLAQLLGTISPNWNIQLVEAPRYRIGTAPTKIGESGEIKNLYRTGISTRQKFPSTEEYCHNEHCWALLINETIDQNWNIYRVKIPQYQHVLSQRKLSSSVSNWCMKANIKNDWIIWNDYLGKLLKIIVAKSEMWINEQLRVPK